VREEYFKMTFEDLEKELPNGFHDAELSDVQIDYVHGSMKLRMSFWVGSMQGPNRDEYRPGELRMTGLYFCTIDPPDPNYRYVPTGSALNVSGDPAKPDTFPALEQLSPTLAPGVSCYRFFVHEWNSFINIAAKDVQVSWVEEGGREGGWPTLPRGT
jgi:hypothetical protein